MICAAHQKAQSLSKESQYLPLFKKKGHQGWVEFSFCSESRSGASLVISVGSAGKSGPSNHGPVDITAFFFERFVGCVLESNRNLILNLWFYTCNIPWRISSSRKCHILEKTFTWLKQNQEEKINPSEILPTSKSPIVLYWEIGHLWSILH